jgi:hypothetical protein
MANLTHVFTVAGIITHNGSTKVRFANDLVRRIKQFSKGGAPRIDLMELPSEMTKIEALRFLQSHADFQSPADQATISDSLEDRVKESKKGEVKVSNSAKPSLESIKARGKKVTKEVTVSSILSLFPQVSATSASIVADAELAADLHNVDPA